MCKKNYIVAFRDRSFMMSQGGGGDFGGGYNFLRGFIFGGVNFENAQNVRGWKYWDRGLAFYVKVVKLYYDWSKSTFPSKVDKKIRFGGSLSETKCYPYKAWPRNRGDFFYQECSVHIHTYSLLQALDQCGQAKTRLCIQLKSGKIYRFFFIYWNHF